MFFLRKLLCHLFLVQILYQGLKYYLLLVCTELLISAPKIITISPKLPLGNEKVPPESNPIPYPLYLYLSMSLFLVILTAPNKQFFNVGLKLLRLDSSS